MYRHPTRRASRLVDLTALRERVAPALRHRWGSTAAWLVALAALVLVLTTLDVLDRGMLTSLDHEASRHLLGLHIRQHTWARRLVYVLTFFGQRGPVLIVTVPTVAYLCWHARSLDLLVRYAFGLLVLTVIVYAIKDGVGRTAPPVDLLHTSAGQSYPSGHLATAVLVWWLLWQHARDLDPHNALSQILRVVRFAGPACVVVGMGLLDYHWLSDFIAGAGIGIIVLALATHRWLTPVSARLDRRWSHSDLT